MNDDYSELRAKHYAVWVPKEQRGECDFCVTPYPCPTIRLLDEVERLRAAIPIGNRDDSMDDMEATIAWGEAEVARLRESLGRIAFGAHVTFEDAKKIAFNALGPWQPIDAALNSSAARYHCHCDRHPARHPSGSMSTGCDRESTYRGECSTGQQNAPVAEGDAP